MTRLGSSITGLIGSTALVIAGATMDLQAQRGGGGQGRPATAGTQAQGHGRPTTPGTQGQTHRPENPGHIEHQTDTDKSTNGAGRTTGKLTVSDQLARNTNLMSRLKTLSVFPADADLTKEAAQFRTLGQFVAAAHVSHNLEIPWADMKAKMTGEHPVSLGNAIDQLKPQADAKTEASKAEKEADTDIKDSNRNKNNTAS
jgi:hypothetical protein